MAFLEQDRIYNIDCIEGMGQIAPQTVDMIFVDLPYGTTQNPWDVVIPPEQLWPEYERILKPRGVILLFGQDKFTATMMLSNPSMHKYNIIWEKTTKTGFLNAKKMPLRCHEDIMVFYKLLPLITHKRPLGTRPLTATRNTPRTAATTEKPSSVSPVEVVPSDTQPASGPLPPTNRNLPSIQLRNQSNCAGMQFVHIQIPVTWCSTTAVVPGVSRWRLF